MHYLARFVTTALLISTSCTFISPGNKNIEIEKKYLIGSATEKLFDWLSMRAKTKSPFPLEDPRPGHRPNQWYTLNNKSHEFHHEQYYIPSKQKQPKDYARVRKIDKQDGSTTYKLCHKTTITPPKGMPYREEDEQKKSHEPNKADIKNLLERAKIANDYTTCDIKKSRSTFIVTSAYNEQKIAELALDTFHQPKSLSPTLECELTPETAENDTEHAEDLIDTIVATIAGYHASELQSTDENNITRALKATNNAPQATDNKPYGTPNTTTY